MDKPLWGLRVQKVQRVQRVQRERFLRWMGLGHTYGLKVLRIDGPFRAQGFLSLTAFQAEGCGIALAGDEYEVSVTGFAFSFI